MLARIGAHLSGVELRLVNRLADANAAVTLNNLHLATEKLINSPSDDPSTFLALSKFQQQLNLVNGSIANATAATSLVSQTQTAIGQVRAQLTIIRDELWADRDRTLTPEERAESQAAIDEAIAAINDLAGTTIDGRRVLDGSADFQISGQTSSQVSDLRVYATGGHGVDGPTRTISGQVIQAAEQAELQYTGASGAVVGDHTFTITGDLGSVEISVTNGQPLAEPVPGGRTSMMTAINDASYKTGVVATVSGDVLTFHSVEYGSAARIEISGLAVTGGNDDGTADGVDTQAEINGLLMTGQGRRFSVNDNGFRYEIEMAAGFDSSFSPITVSGNALGFALSTDTGSIARLAIPGLRSAILGGISGRLDQIASGGNYSGLDENAAQALRIVDQAIGQVARLQGNVEGFLNSSITAQSEMLNDLKTQLEDAIPATDGFNQVEEETLLSKNEELVSNSIAALEILNQQRSTMVLMLQKAAGLI